MSEANNKQVGGEHYIQHGELQPWDVIHQLKLGYFEGTAFKYLVRWKDKGGIQDLKKAIHFLEKLIEVTEVEEQISSIVISRADRNDRPVQISPINI